VLPRDRNHGRLTHFGAARPAVFDDGVRLGLAQHANAAHVIFAARTAGLKGKVDAEGLPDYLSGILIGIEIGSVLARHPLRDVALLGDDALCERYRAALRIADVGTTHASPDATTRGQWQVAVQAGLVEEKRACKV